MDQVFSVVLQTGIYSFGIIFIIVLLRILFKKRVSKTVLCALWIFAAIRLLIPVQIESDFALIPEISPIEMAESMLQSRDGQTDNDIQRENNKKDETERLTKNTEVSKVKTYENKNKSTENLNQAEEKEYGNIVESGVVSNRSTIENNVARIFSILGYVWLLGMTVFLLILGRRYIKVKKKLKNAVLLAPYDDVYSTEAIGSAFVFGVLRPRIYVSSLIGREQLDYVLEHERAHIVRKDYITKLFAYLLLSVYWFVPWVWAAYILFGRDVELACDEKVITQKSEVFRADYAQVLLDSTIRYNHREFGMVSFGEEKIRDRIESVVNYKKRSLMISLAVFIAAGIGLTIFLFVKTSGKGVKGQEDQALVNALETEYTSFSQEIYDMIAEDWAKYEALDYMQRVTSSHAPGYCSRSFDNWAEATAFIGVTPWNPFENEEWLEMTKDSRTASLKKNSMVSFYSTEFDGENDGKLKMLNLTSNYPLESGFVELNTILYSETACSPWPENESGDIVRFSFDVKKDGNLKTIETEIKVVHSNNYDAVRIALPAGSDYKYSIDIISYSGTENLSGVFDKVCDTIGLPMDFNELEMRRMSIKDNGKTENKSIHTITYNLGELAEQFTVIPKSAETDGQVEIRTQVMHDADIHLYIDDLEIEKTHSDSDYWGYSFTMPDRDIVITLKPSEKGESSGYANLFWDYMNNKEKILGMDYKEVHEVYGEPSGSLSGFWGDIYTNNNGESIVLYYNGTTESVETIKKSNLE